MLVKTKEELDNAFEIFALGLEVETIDLYNKLDNISDMITEVQMCNIMDNFPSAEVKVFTYIKAHLKEYKEDIISEAIIIKEEYRSTELFDLAAGLYNMDFLYMNALKEYDFV